MLAVAGLGGLGKTTLCTEVLPILARLQARPGKPSVPVLALDGQAAKDSTDPIEELWKELAAFQTRLPDAHRNEWPQVLANAQEPANFPLSLCVAN